MLLTLLAYFTLPSSTSQTRQVPTFFGWTPGLRGLVGCVVLECGCQVGTYDSWRDELLVIVDAQGIRCTHEEHRDNTVLFIGGARGN